MSFDWLVARPIAHRGLHGPGRPENSLAAAKAAIAADYAIECDIQRTADGETVVFHDDTLERLTGAQGRVGDMTLAALRELALLGTGERIPTLAELLRLIAGRVPLVCEIKSDFDGDTRLSGRAAEIGQAYDGPLAFKSFDPEVIAFLRAGACPRPLGIVAEASYDDPYFATLTTAQKQRLRGIPAYRAHRARLPLLVRRRSAARRPDAHARARPKARDGLDGAPAGAMGAGAAVRGSGGVRGRRSLRDHVEVVPTDDARVDTRSRRSQLVAIAGRVADFMERASRSLRHRLQAFAVAEHDLAGAVEAQGALLGQRRQRTRHRLQRQAEIVADVAPAHRQRHHARHR